jgi:hypothetical protein
MAVMMVIMVVPAATDVAAAPEARTAQAWRRGNFIVGIPDWDPILGA